LRLIAARSLYQMMTTRLFYRHSIRPPKCILQPPPATSIEPIGTSPAADSLLS
jgi:hypothetical protein